MLTQHYRSTAGIGAVLTILAIGIGPTVQQMITIQSRLTDSPQAASIGRAQSYLQSGQAETVFEESLPTTEMIGAIYSGMFFSPGGGITLDMAPSCSSGNCTFSPFQSLAACSTCEDVTHLLTRTCHQAKIDETIGEPNTSKEVTLYCNYALPNKLNVNVTGEEEITGAFVSSGYLPHIGQPKYGNSFLDFCRIRGPTSDVEGKKLSDSTAMQCSLNWCINTYQARVESGKIQENTTSTWYADTADWISNGTMNSEHIQLRPPADPSAQHLTNPNFTVGYLASLGLTAWLGEKMTLSNSYAAMVDDQGAEEWGPDDSVNGTSGSDDMIRVFRDSDMNTLFPNIAKSITRNIRNVNASQQTTTESTEGYLANVTGVGPANGTMHTLEVYVSVRWPWITFSAVLVVTAILLLAMTALETARHDVAIWKASPLPLLLHGLGDEKTTGFAGAKQLVEMEDLANGIGMRLKDGSSEWTLSKLR